MDKVLFAQISNLHLFVARTWQKKYRYIEYCSEQTIPESFFSDCLLLCTSATKMAWHPVHIDDAVINVFFSVQLNLIEYPTATAVTVKCSLENVCGYEDCCVCRFYVYAAHKYICCRAPSKNHTKCIVFNTEKWIWWCKSEENPQQWVTTT